MAPFLNLPLTLNLYLITKTNKKLFIAGDFNINLLKLDHHLQTSNFLNTMASFKLIPVILRPTRITEITATLIEHIYTNSNQKMDSCILVEDISDHLPIILFVEVEHTNIIKSNKVNKRNFSEQNIRHFVTSLQTVDFPY